MATIDEYTQIPETEMCERYEALYTPAVNDVLREMGYLDRTLPSNIMPLREEMNAAGIAFTVKGAKSLVVDGEMEDRVKMLEELHSNAIVIWDTGGDDVSAQWGEIMTLTAIRQGCRGAVIDGGVRDTKKILEQKFPVFCKYKSSNGMLGRFRMIGWQIPVKIGRVDIYPGDVIFGDIDGVIVIPRKIAYDVLLKAEKIKVNEVVIKNNIAAGQTPAEVVENGGYF